MSFEICAKCEKFLWDGEQCSCRLFFALTSQEDYERWGYSHEEVALAFAKKYNSENDHCLLDEEENIIVSDGEKAYVYEISAEESIEYSVNRVEDGGLICKTL